MALLFAWSDYNSNKKQLLATTKAEVSRFDLALSRRLEYVIQDVLLLASSLQLKDTLQRNDPQATDYATITGPYAPDIKQVYDQIRWIDETGMERIRVNWTAESRNGDGCRIFSLGDISLIGKRASLITPKQLSANLLYILIASSCSRKHHLWTSTHTKSCLMSISVSVAKRLL